MVEEKDKVKENQVIDTTKYNKSVHFLLPMLGLQLGYYSTLINCYIADVKNKPEIKNYHLFLHLKYEDEKLRGIAGFREQYPVSGGIMYVIRIPKQFDEDYLKFILGEYSKFSIEYKNLIFRLLTKPINKRNVYKVITKDIELKKIIEDKIGCSIGDQEVLSSPNMENEIYG